MTTTDFDELSSRIDAVGHTLLILIAELELRGTLDGPALSKGLRRFGRGRSRHPGRERSGRVIQELAQRLDTARANRSTGC
ncbi:MAG: hypothetical protein RR101_13600 [Burkholderiaceae bacterium]